MNNTTVEMYCKKCKKNVPIVTISIKKKTVIGIILAFFGFAPGVQHSEPTHRCMICKSRIST